MVMLEKKYDIWIQWYVTKYCNLDCDYCIAKKNSYLCTKPAKPDDHSDIDTPLFLKSLNKTGKTFHITFTGGEPFLVPNLIDACKEITQDHFISINTNLISDKIGYFAEKIDPSRVCFVYASFHMDELEKKKKVDMFIDNYLLLKEKGFIIAASAVAHPSILGKINKYKALLLKHDIKLSFVPFIGNYDKKKYPMAYSKDQIAKLGFSREDISRYDWKGKPCNVGVNSAFVNAEGDAIGCIVNKNQIGNIYDNISFKKNMVLCKHSFCPCPMPSLNKVLYNNALMMDNTGKNIPNTNFRHTYLTLKKAGIYTLAVIEDVYLYAYHGIKNLFKKTEKRKINTQNLQAIITCVDYSDYLTITLSENLKVLKNITVITSTKDKKTQRLCKLLDVDCIVTGSFYHDGADFNKGRAINEGLKKITTPGWVVLLDADIVLPKNLHSLLDGKKLDIHSIYQCNRYHCSSYEKFLKLKKGKITLDKLGGKKILCKYGYGFFQIFNLRHFLGSDTHIYPENFSDAGFVDVAFSNKFDSKHIKKRFLRKKDLNPFNMKPDIKPQPHCCLKDINVIHLDHGFSLNWHGRKTKEFIDKSEQENIINIQRKCCAYQFAKKFKKTILMRT